MKLQQKNVKAQENICTKQGKTYYTILYLMLKYLYGFTPIQYTTSRYIDE